MQVRGSRGERWRAGKRTAALSALPSALPPCAGPGKTKQATGQLARRTGYHRTTIAHAEAGDRASRDQAEAADRVLGTGGRLTAARDAISASIPAYGRGLDLLSALYASQRLPLPLHGVLLVGY
jgi:hypothetical protein